MINKDLRYQQGIEQGIEPGITQGIEKGIEKNIEGGILEAKIYSIRKMLNHILWINEIAVMLDVTVDLCRTYENNWKKNPASKPC